MQFPLFKTKIKGEEKKFNLNDPEERQAYFQFKAGEEIKKLKKYFEEGGTFIVYLLGKKNSGKGTYAKMFAEVVGQENIEHFSIGDMIRDMDEELRDEEKRKELVSFLEKNYRGWSSVEELISLMEERSTKTLLPTELILALIKREIARKGKKTIFIDGFPRGLDQINFTLFFRDLIGYREDVDFFALINVAENIIDERIKYRVVCPVCHTSRNLKLLPTSRIGYDSEKQEFYLLCDNPHCPNGGEATRMVPKEGDEFGIDPIRERLARDEELIKKAFSLHGIPKILLRNSVPVEKASEIVDDYEITPEYYYEWDEKEEKVVTKEKPWVVMDDEKQPSYSLMPPPVVVSLIKQITDILDL